MVNPTGYTALDMIGFTDKGTYLSSENYVKNDLVHSSGNIWRCLIDDTTGIAPVEGVNWTLFIGEPTNLVERIIAPVETDPAANAWTVGRQIIFNDNLYEVITAITAGDALVAYEDDPTNANIKLADPVETQLLNEKATRAAADLALQNALSHRNLLDNPWFTVNQRGLDNYSYSSDSKHYNFDRWFLGSSGISISKSNDIFTVSATNKYNAISQKFPIDYIKEGDTYTLSVLFDDDTIESRTFVAQAASPPFLGSWTHGSNKFNSLVTGQYSDQWQIIPFDYLGSNTETPVTISFKAIKLEKGSVSTLAMDTAPNYAEELLKCQRYFYRYKANDSSAYMGMGGIQSTNNLRFILNLPTTMRQSPTITYSGSFNIADFGASNISTNITNITKQAFHGNSIVIIVQSSDTLVVATPAILKANSDANAYIDFSADL